MKFSSILLLAGLAAGILSASEVTYTYTGNPFEVATGLYTTSDFVSGYFTLSSALGDSQTLEAITPDSYSFSDGVQTISSASPPPDVTFEVSTDLNGNISGWFINLETPSGPYSQISTETTPNQEDLGALGNDEGYNFFDKGAWLESGGGTSPVPEPGNVALIGLGLVGIGLVRRKLQARPSNS